MFGYVEVEIDNEIVQIPYKAHGSMKKIVVIFECEDKYKQKAIDAYVDMMQKKINDESE